MSSQNAFPGQGTGRPARILNQDQQRQPAWPSHPVPTAAAPAPSPSPFQQLAQQQAQPQAGWPPQQPAPAYAAPRPTPYAQWGGLQAPQNGPQPQHATPQYAPPQPLPQHPPQHAAAVAADAYAPQSAPVDPYAPQFEPYAAQRQAQNFAPAGPAPSFGYGQPQQPLQPQPLQHQAPQWPQRVPASRDMDASAYAPARQPLRAAPQPVHSAPAFNEPRYQAADPGLTDWANEPSLGVAADPYQEAQTGAEFGFAQAEGGELDPAYADDDGDYEIEPAPRGRRPMMIAAALVGAILVGGGMAYSYKKIALGGGSAQGDPPVIRSEQFASKTKPADAGGKQFPYADSKIMSRLGDGTASASAADSNSGSSPSSDTSVAPSSSVDENGTRKVSTLVVGRDGTIQAPPSAPVAQAVPASATLPDVAVPGTSLVDVFGASRGQHAAGPAPSESASQPSQKLASADTSDAPPQTKKHATPAAISKTTSATAAKAAPATTGSVDTSDDAPVAATPVKKKLKKIAKADTTATDASSDAAAPSPITSPSGSSGFVAVLASVPKSSSSRMDALKRFADMQQKYATALAGKTPDVAEANVSGKGYHRLVVGPPGPRDQASAICMQLKAEGYTGCWVTAY